MFKKNKTILFVMCVALTGCGETRSGTSSLFSSGLGNTQTPSTPNSGNLPTTPTTNAGGNVTPNTATTTSKGVPPIQFRVGTVGYNSVTLTVSTGKILKVKFTPGVQDQVVPGTGFTANYSGLGVYIGVGSNNKPTPLLYNGLFGGTAQTSAIMDFSSTIAANCPTNDATCRKDVVITVSQPNNDYWCLNYSMYCPWTHVYDTHPWNGNLFVQTDDTDSI